MMPNISISKTGAIKANSTRLWPLGSLNVRRLDCPLPALLGALLLPACGAVCFILV